MSTRSSVQRRPSPQRRSHLQACETLRCRPCSWSLPMSDTSRTDDSAPSLSAYPPAFVSLITTFIKRAEEAETRAHKALVILRAKDSQVIQLQKRMEVLEKIASRLEEVMVPPLNLPPSPQSSEEEEACYPRDHAVVGRSQRNNGPPLETLYERYPTSQGMRNKTEAQEVHNCYTRCQHLIDGLERSNCQLREALTEESQQRVKDHEQYVSTLAKVTQAVKDMTSQSQDSQEQTQNMSSPKGVMNNDTTGFGAAGDSQAVPQIQEDDKPQTNQMSLVNKTEFRDEINLAENIIKALCGRLERGMSNTRSSSFGTKRKSSKKVQVHKSKSSVSIYQTPRSSVTSYKSKRKPQALHLFVSALKKQNKRLKAKCQHFCEKFKESVSLCESLQRDIVTLTDQNNSEQKEVKMVNQSVQTGKILSIPMVGRVPMPGKVSIVGNTRSTHLLQGRLDAAAQVMARQCKQIQGLRQDLAVSNSTVNSLKKRLSRAEAAAAGKEMVDETFRKQLQDSEDKNYILAQEVQQLKDALNGLKQQLSTQIEESNKEKKQKEEIAEKFEEMRCTMESQLQFLSSTLQARDALSDQATSELEAKLSRLKEQFVAQVSEASQRLVAADSKIQELYLGIETFLKLLFSVTKTSTPSDLSPSSQAQAVQMASDILQLEPGQVQTFLHSSRYENYMVSRWIKECKRLVHDKVFAKNLGHFLLDTVLEARLC
ncbi:myosin heavy chain, striated muscle-like isoform X2 [Homalodisca vitripennis]|uniref:myosin heavy chain, striated muscle-like isoform X2 n=1 Tax=Homalodisca vitripennis TaxID=197043 RepID=UPI001EEC86AF|nr:myosin heavy chain, striated muscle-like isoform X2 [Homalodisca vitripennis]